MDVTTIPEALDRVNLVCSGLYILTVQVPLVVLGKYIFLNFSMYPDDLYSRIFDVTAA